MNDLLFKLGMINNYKNDIIMKWIDMFYIKISKVMCTSSHIEQLSTGRGVTKCDHCHHGTKCLA